MCFLERRIEDILSDLDPKLRKVVERIQPDYQSAQAHHRLPADWLHWQIIQRHMVLKHANIARGSSILEIGSGPHAIATLVLAILVGKQGRLSL